MKITILYPALLAVLISNPQVIRAEESTHKLPILDCKVTFAEGSFFGYGQLQPGDTLRFDVGNLGSITNLLTFTRHKETTGPATPYIPILAPLHIEKLERGQNGNLSLAHIVSASTNGDKAERLTFDIQSSETGGAMWIVEEHDGIVMSVARLVCKVSD